MIRRFTKTNRPPIKTPEEMLLYLSRFRNDLMDYYSNGIGIDLDDGLPCLDMILRLDKEVRHYQWVLRQGMEKDEYKNMIEEMNIMF